MATVALCMWLAAPVAAQDPVAEADSAQNDQALRVFFDCQGGGRGGLCDFNFYRREIPFVNYTRDRADAQVHLLITREGTGAGGQLYTLDFIGREDFEGIDDRLTVGTIPNEASEQSMTRIAASVRLGLLRYIARTDQASDIQVIYEVTESGDAGNVARPEDDKWDFWTFRVRMTGGLNVDARTESYRLNGGFSANRITDDLKLEFSIGGNYNESRFEINDSTTVTSIREGYNFEGLNVWSLNERWSFGVNYETGRSTFGNYDLRIEGGPAIEYNIFPYRESTRRQLSFLYTVGVRHYKYIEPTVFLRTEETRPRHELSAGLGIRQPWGGAYGSLEFSQYLHDLEKNRFEVRLGADFRLFRGLSLNFNTNYQRIRDQLNVPAGDATEEEVLLRQRILLSGFEYSFSVGFSYTFGSIFTNVVNPRMERF
jgi:hypothetical protein